MVRRFCPADKPEISWANTSRRPRNRSVTANVRRALSRCSGRSANRRRICGGMTQQTWGFINSPSLYVRARSQNSGLTRPGSYQSMTQDSREACVNVHSFQVSDRVRDRFRERLQIECRNRAFPFWDSGFLGSRSLLRSKRLPAAQPKGIEADWARDGSVSLSDQIAGTIQSDRHNYGELYWGWQRLRGKFF